VEQLEMFFEEDLVVKEFWARYNPTGLKEWPVPEDSGANQIAAFKFLEKVRAAEADFLAHHHVRYV